MYAALPSHKCWTSSISDAPPPPDPRFVRYASALSADAAFTEFARAYLHRKHESFPRKLCAPHFWQLQSPCFHLDEVGGAPPPGFLSSVAVAVVGATAVASPLSFFPCFLSFFFLSFFTLFFFTPPSTSRALSLGAVGFGRSFFGFLGARFVGFVSAAPESLVLSSAWNGGRRLGSTLAGLTPNKGKVIWTEHVPSESVSDVR